MQYAINSLLILVCCAGIASAQRATTFTVNIDEPDGPGFIIGSRAIWAAQGTKPVVIVKPPEAPVEQKPLVIPEAQAARIRDAQQQIACLREPNCTLKQIAVLELASQNALLDACIELGLSKKQLEGLQLRVDEQGQLVLARLPPPQVEPKPEPAKTKPQP